MRPQFCASLLLMVLSWNQLPNQTGSFKFAAVGNSGTGKPSQYELADRMATFREGFKYDAVILLGGNVPGDARPGDFIKKFEAPYKRLLDAGVTFHAALGDEDARDSRYYKNFNMKGNAYYTFEPRPDVQFVALDSSDVNSAQIAWLSGKLEASKSPWKIVYLHHPLYSSSRQQAANRALRQQLEPLFVKHNVSAVLSAHDNVYERTRPQNGITYFVVGSGGSVKQGAIDRNSGLTAAGFDTDLAFLAAEVAGDQLHFTAVSRTGQTVDSGVLARRQ